MKEETRIHIKESYEKIYPTLTQEQKDSYDEACHHLLEYMLESWILINEMHRSYLSDKSIVLNLEYDPMYPALLLKGITVKSDLFAE